MRNAIEEPAKSRPFQSPAQREPLPIKLNREDECDEKEGDATEPCQLRISNLRVGPRAKEENQSNERRDREECGQKAHDAAGVGLLREIVDEQKVPYARKG